VGKDRFKIMQITPVLELSRRTLPLNPSTGEAHGGKMAQSEGKGPHMVVKDLICGYKGTTGKGPGKGAHINLLETATTKIVRKLRKSWCLL